MATTQTHFKEEEVTIDGSAFPLKGTLTLPETHDKRPAILIIPGSGTSDRDGKNKKFNMRMYKDIADFLSNLGFITLRYDKRGVGGSGGDFYETGLLDLIDDGVACVEFLKHRAEVDPVKVIALGHSEGCFIAPAINARVDVQGLILLSGVAESGRDNFPRQNERAYKELEGLKGFKGFLVRKLRVVAKARKKNEAIMRKLLTSEKAVERIFGKRINAKWLREHYAYNVREVLPQVTCPVLAITGSKDIQVMPDHARLLAEGVSGVGEWHIVKNMTHILRKTEETPSLLGAIKLYQQLSTKPTDPELLTLMEKWLERYFGHDAFGIETESER